jgi:uncharacterized OB-fold protein
MRQGTVYTETIIHSAPEQFAAEAPYQIAVVELTSGEKLLARIQGKRATIGDHVAEKEATEGYPTFEVV